ncbi:tungsten-containing aldehyde:ferredoxin oxidoreductase Aor [Clostridium aceticum]|uniref:Tungsten-containing aldehyde:ferredoxin oxidoreductase Aor n=1 Tax=Clostridium aceticum TaxID=84022 RepID=A0A0D8I781_9CLOT|nr:aldehyde ferredoxin oxidoreductase C-terminal domain-containing protein [Clostridium aceticum]AKL94306.1 tungsten-containing aldehyde:ferredoxin oxidoreductase Aor [Clostridium aceticum]KJF26150.1 aldehyde:ferredoxin oxidoreductase [Clostridium aceticum]
MADKIIRVNMGTKEITVKDLDERFTHLGGRGLTSQIVYEEVRPTCNPLGEENKLIFSPGLLTGTMAPSSGRLSVGGKSPLTKGIKEANAGGVVGQKMANLGIRAIVIEGLPLEVDLHVLIVNDEGVKLQTCPELKGKGCYETTDVLRQKYGEKAAVCCIGPSGEMLMTNAGIATSDAEGNASRFAARGGLGAVMGSKGLKAIVVETSKKRSTQIHDEENFKKAAKRLTTMLQDHPVTGEGLTKYGTNILMNIINEAGGLPTKNFAQGRFEHADAIGGEKLAEIAEARGGSATHRCMPGCVIGCSNEYPLPSGKTISPIEYETAWAFGAHCEISSLDDIGELNWLANDLGLDTIEAGGTLGILMEAGVIPWGDGKKALEALAEVGKGSPLGRIIGQGSVFTGQAFGVTKIAAVKGQHMPAYDPRSIKGIGVTYATTPMGADHTAGYCITANILKVGGVVDPLKREGQVDLSRNLQIASTLIDSTGFCLFIAFAILDNEDAMPTIVELLNTRFGWNFSVEDALMLGQRTLKVERDFNVQAGFTKEHDRLPDFMMKEKLAPHDIHFDIGAEELDTFYNF